MSMFFPSKCLSEFWQKVARFYTINSHLYSSFYGNVVLYRYLRAIRCSLKEVKIKEREREKESVSVWEREKYLYSSFYGNVVPHRYLRAFRCSLNEVKIKEREREGGERKR